MKYFFKTPLDYILKKMNISTLIITKCNFPNCPRSTIYQASDRDFKIVVVKDALSGLYQSGIKELENIGIFFHSAKKVLSKM